MEIIFNFLRNHLEFTLGVALTCLFFSVVTAPSNEPEYKYDINNDGVVDIKDMLVIQKYILDNEEVEK